MTLLSAAINQLRLFFLGKIVTFFSCEFITGDRGRCYHSLGKLFLFKEIWPMEKVQVDWRDTKALWYAPLINCTFNCHKMGTEPLTELYVGTGSRSGNPLLNESTERCKRREVTLQGQTFICLPDGHLDARPSYETDVENLHKSSFVNISDHDCLIVWRDTT